MEFYLLADNTKKIFNILNLSKENEINEWDKRWSEFWNKGKDFSFLKSPFFDASYNEIRFIWQRMGYSFDFSFCFAWKFRNSLPLFLQEKPVAVVIHSPDGKTNEKIGYQEFLQNHGFRVYSYPYDCLSEEWVGDILRRHSGSWDEVDEMEFIPVPFKDRAVIAIIDADICNDSGFSVFQTFQRSMEKNVPVFVVSDFKNYDMMRIGQVMKMGAECIIDKQGDYLKKLEESINDSMPTVSASTVAAGRK